MITNLRKLFLFSKLDHFFEQFEMGKLEKPLKGVTQQNQFSTLIEYVKDGQQQQFNNELKEYLSQGQLNIDQLLTLLQSLYQTNMYCSKMNKDALLQQMKINTNQYDERAIAITQYGFQNQICDQELVDKYVQFFIQCNVNEFSLSQGFDIIFVFSQAMKKYKINGDINIFSKQWGKLIGRVLDSLDQNEKLYIEKYPHLAYIIKILINEQKIHIDIIEDLKHLFEKITYKFMSNHEMRELNNIQLTILFSSIIRIREKFLKDQMNELLQRILKYLQKSDFNEFNDQSIQSFTFCLTTLQDYQSIFAERINQYILKQIKNNKFHPKFHISILYEIYLKWSLQISLSYLKQILTQISTNNCSEYDLAQLFQLLTLLDSSVVNQILNNIKSDLSNRTYYDVQATMRLKKSMSKLRQQAKPEHKQIIDKLQSLF